MTDSERADLGEAKAASLRQAFNRACEQYRIEKDSMRAWKLLYEAVRDNEAGLSLLKELHCLRKENHELMTRAEQAEELNESMRYEIGALKEQNFVLVNGEGVSQLQEEYSRLTEAVKRHHADRGHQRCWENDVALYREFGLEPGDPQNPPIEEHRKKCDEYRAELFQVPVEGEPCYRIRFLKQQVFFLKQALDESESKQDWKEEWRNAEDELQIMEREKDDLERELGLLREEREKMCNTLGVCSNLVSDLPDFLEDRLKGK